MLYIIEMYDECGFFKRLVYDSESQCDHDYNVLIRDYGERCGIRKRTYKEVEE